MRTHRSTTRRPSRRAFSMVELLMVIGIIVLLVSIALVAGPAVMGMGKVRKTEATLRTAQALLTEYLQLTEQDQVLSEGTNSNNSTYAVPSIDALIKRAQKKERLKDLVAAFDDKALVKEGDEWQLYDAWGEVILFNRSGKEDGVAKGKNAAGDTVDFSSQYKMPERNRPYFVSMGEDGLLGDWKNDTDEPAPSGGKWDENGDDVSDSADNHFSIEVR